jgi:hypothetical protein
MVYGQFIGIMVVMTRKGMQQFVIWVKIFPSAKREGIAPAPF